MSGSWPALAMRQELRQSNLVRLGMLRLHMRARQPARLSEAERGAAVAGGSINRWRAPAAGRLRPKSKLSYIFISLFLKGAYIYFYAYSLQPTKWVNPLVNLSKKPAMQVKSGQVPKCTQRGQS
jgi:hypothetical protein